jgi:hypothetical protein
MLSFKFKLIILVLTLPLSLHADEVCLGSHFETIVSHKGQPFGLTETKLGISKSGCVIEINHEKLRFIKKNWLIDVCRSPVHIKTGAGAVTVLRREVDCLSEESAVDPFCLEIEDIKRVMEDDGLIFAEGDKNNLSDPHGKVTCVVKLIQRYLNEGQVLSIGDFQFEPQRSAVTQPVKEVEFEEEMEPIADEEQMEPQVEQVIEEEIELVE